MDMKKVGACDECGGKRFAAAEEVEVHEVAGTEYRIPVPARRCLKCGAVVVDGPATIRAEQLVAQEVARRGPANAETFRFMRSALMLKAARLAELLGVRAETISRWEQGHGEPDRGAWSTLGAMVTEAVDGRCTTRDRLEALRKPGRPPKTVRLVLSRAR